MPLRLARAFALLALATTTTILAPDAKAQRQDTTPTYTVVFGGFDFLHATGVAINGVPLTSRTDLDRVSRLTLAGLSFPSGGPKGGDCNFEAPTCNGRIVVTDPSVQVRVCYDLFNVAITPAMSDAASGVLKEEISVEFISIVRADACPQED